MPYDYQCFNNIVHYKRVCEGGAQSVPLGAALAPPSYATTKTNLLLLRPGWPAILGIVIRQWALAAAIRIHHINIVVAIAVACECQLAAVGVPGRGIIGSRAIGQPL